MELSQGHLTKNGKAGTDLDYSETITRKRGLFDRLMGRSPLSAVVAANQLIAIWGTQGGVGCSTITAILAKLLHQIGFTVLVIEAASTGGSLLRFMGRKPVTKGLDTISHTKERFNSELDSIKVNVVKGFTVIPRSGASYNAQWHWQEDEARELYHFARRHAAFVLVDAGHALNDAIGRIALTEADHIVSVFRPTPVGLDSATRFHEHCRFSGLKKNLIWVMNQAQRAGSKLEMEFLTGEEITNCILWKHDMELFEQGASIPKSIQEETADLLQQILSANSARVFQN